MTIVTILSPALHEVIRGFSYFFSLSDALPESNLEVVPLIRDMTKTLQGHHSNCFLGCVDIKAKVLFQSMLNIQRPAKKCANLAKQDPGRAKQNR